MADLIYANGKLWDAVGILATHPGRIHDRLIVACRSSLVFVPEHVLPSYLEPIYQRVWQKVASSSGSNKEGTFVPSITDLTDDQAVAVANDVVELAYRVREAAEADLDRRSRGDAPPG